ASLQVDPEALVLHVLAAPTAEQIEAELGEVAPEEPEVPAAPEAAAAEGGGAEGRGAETPAPEGEPPGSLRWIIGGLGNPGPDDAGAPPSAERVALALLATR